MLRLWILGVTSLLLLSNIIVAKEVTKRFMRVSEEGKKLIEKFEKRRQDVYICPGGKTTSGIGHALTPAERRLHKVGSHVENIQIDKWFQEDLEKTARIVSNWVVVDLTQNQFDALVSFVFNVGADQFKRSSLLKLINKGAYSKASEEFSRWVHARGKKLPGLVVRRSEEAEMFKREMAEDPVA